MSQGNQPGIKIFIADVSEENIEDAIKEITKSYGGKNKKIKKSDEFLLDDMTVKEISNNTIDLYQKIEKDNNGYNYYAFFDLGGAYIDSNSSSKFMIASSIVQTIAIKATENKMNEIIKSEKHNLENLVDDKKKLEKDNSRATKDIEDAKDLISKKEKEIEENLKAIDLKNKEIENQNNKIEDLKNSKASIKLKLN